jgi:hypothetical protein
MVEKRIISSDGLAVDITRLTALCSSAIVKLEPELPKKLNSLVIQGAICIWAVGVFIWYFYEFSPVISPILKKFIMNIWN